ncbi:endonuclease/exonuclease/phosphatase family protein [Halomonas sp. M4R1S46]|uniref:endonuclease/exonuclease/phosphatase family protein n=1 Tax=Halomonas sp. M4R1S46 TaxID=2982692 RepID=UPI0021E3F6AC|nr:endonuclease/exonuclease/phosphatase family protein [Halomonas sp. M4R1S46]UYG08324.1 endonuclease/exonuclease/phosphatase family protein [Halomonas sp. M4R1S46]
MIYPQYRAFVVEDIVRLRRRLARAGIPPRCTDDNFIVGTWNIRDFGDLFDDWTENPDSPKRNLRGLAIIAEIVRHFDVVALQEVKRQTTALRVLQERFLGPHWDLMLTDVTAGDKGRQERQAYLFDRRRISPSGLAGEIVLPPTADGDPQEQFDRTPYLVGFQANGEHFALLSAHIRYGDEPAERLPELRRLAHFVAREIRDRAREDAAEEANLIVLGDFNIDRRQGNPLFDAFVATGHVPIGGISVIEDTAPFFQTRGRRVDSRSSRCPPHLHRPLHAAWCCSPIPTARCSMSVAPGRSSRVPTNSRARHFTH